VGPSDAELVARVLASDDRHAFATLVRRHQAPVRALLRRLACGDAALADDLAQETFLAAYHHLGRFRGDARLGSWLYRIAYNRWLDASRSGAARRRNESSIDPGVIAVTLDRVEARHDLERAMTVLREPERAALALTYGADATHEETAEILGCPIGTVKSYILGAKQKLREALSPPQPLAGGTTP
jgi:RNA polymerase sigma-70 factor (ECF subfamily)